jgi:hypothetical protein
MHEARNAGHACRKSSLSQPETAAKLLRCRISTGFGTEVTGGRDIAGGTGCTGGPGISGGFWGGVVQAATAIKQKETSKLENLDGILRKNYVVIVS